MFGEDRQCWTVLGLVSVWWGEVEGEQGEVDGSFFLVFGLGSALGEMDLVAVPVRLLAMNVIIKRHQSYSSAFSWSSSLNT